MKIEIAEKEITAGVRLALQQTLGLQLAGKNFEVDYTMGRGRNKLTAVVTVSDANTESPAVLPQETIEPGTIGAAIAEATGTPKAAVVEEVTETKEAEAAAEVPPAKTEVVEAKEDPAPEVAATADGDEDNLFG